MNRIVSEQAICLYLSLFSGLDLCNVISHSPTMRNEVWTSSQDLKSTLSQERPQMSTSIFALSISSVILCRSEVTCSFPASTSGNGDEQPKLQVLVYSLEFFLRQDIKISRMRLVYQLIHIVLSTSLLT